jgi:hypothetical protein
MPFVEIEVACLKGTSGFAASPRRDLPIEQFGTRPVDALRPAPWPEPAAWPALCFATKQPALALADAGQCFPGAAVWFIP